jgi:hypothetical protein
MGSTLFKDSNDIKFEIFGLVDYFQCILQDLDISSNLNSNLNRGLTRV